MKIRDIKIASIVKTVPETTILEAAKIMRDRKIGSILVEDNGDLVGVVTERDILRKVVAEGRNTSNTIVKNIMTTPLIKIDEDEEIENANELMVTNKIRRLITTKNGKDTGIVTMTDISKNMRFLLVKRLLEK